MKTDTLNEFIGGKVKDVRVMRGMTQAQLAERLGDGWHQQTILRIESGSRPLRVSELMSFAEQLRVEPRALYDGSFVEIAVSTATERRVEELESTLRKIQRLATNP
ncbi:helix-turn-helix domain-containing protein [Rhodococcus sp. MALMAid1271]|uniref:helix-turn-helix domain-containing protein n=1 Tax=Rhodococcus sp. MALMAid1271 TaxID=3411744 RepID=UPI003B9FFA34